MKNCVAMSHDKETPNRAFFLTYRKISINILPNEFLTKFFNSDIVMTRRRLSTYLKTYKIPRQSLRQLNNKKLLLIGGGNSRIQHAFNMLKINCHVTNIAPYIITPQNERLINLK